MKYLFYLIALGLLIWGGYIADTASGYVALMLGVASGVSLNAAFVAQKVTEIKSSVTTPETKTGK